MWKLFTRDTADQREIKRLEGLIEVLTDERDNAVALSKKTFVANCNLVRTNSELRQEVAEQTRNASKLGQKLTETKKALEVECDRANDAHNRLYSFTAPRRRDPRGRFLPLRDMGTAA